MPELQPVTNSSRSNRPLQTTKTHASILSASDFRPSDAGSGVVSSGYFQEGLAKGKPHMSDMTVRKGTTQRFDFQGEPVTWTSYKIEKDDISRSYASCSHPIYRRYFGASDTLVANLVNLSQMLEEGSEDKKFFILLLNSYIIE